MPGRQSVGGKIRALGFSGVRQPMTQSSGEPFAVAFQLVRGQHRWPGPGREDEALGGHQWGQAAAALGDHVSQCQPEPLALAQGPVPSRRDQPFRLVGRALEHRVQRVAGTGEDPVEPPRGQVRQSRRVLARPPSSARRRAGTARPASRRGRPARRRRRAGRTPPPAAGNSPAVCGGPPSSAAARPRWRPIAGKASFGLS